MYAAWITRQLVFDGMTQGIVIGLMAMGIVLIYRSTRVINFAVANLGLVGAGLLVLLNRQYHVPYWISVAVALAAGTLYGVIVELLVIRRLFSAPRVIVLVSTIGIAQLSMVLLFVLPEVKSTGKNYPQPIGSSWTLSGITVKGPQLTALLVVPILAVMLGWVMNRSMLGKKVKASAENPDLARLSSVSPKTVSTIVWGIAGALATFSMSLLAGLSGSSNDLTGLGPSTMVRALAAAVVAGMVSFPRAFGAGVVLGIVQAVVSFNMLQQPGLFDFLVLLVVLAAVFKRSKQSASETQAFSYGSKNRPIPERLRAVWWVKAIDRMGFAILGLVAILLPILISKPSRQLTFTSILAITIAALSLTVLTGWAGQLSLGQMAFAGLGAFLTAGFVRGINFDLKIGSVRLLKAGISPVAHPLAMVLAVAITACIATLVGATALRVRGLMLAVSTLAFGFAASQYLYRRPILTGGIKGQVPFKRAMFLGMNVKSQKAWYYVALAITAVVIAAIARLRRTGIARTTIAVRDNPDAAAAYTVSATKTNLRAFALAGALAALGGSIFAANVQVVPNDRFFGVTESLALVAAVVIGGLGSVGGTVLGAAWVQGLPSFFPGNTVVPLLTSSIGLLLLLLYFPGGFVQMAFSLRTMVIKFAERRMPAPEPKPREVRPPVSIRADRAAVAPGVAALKATDVVVRFGGISALDGASVEVGHGEVVGLIGTNGAGKSTLMNAIGGFVPSVGAIELAGSRIEGMPAAERAKLGLGRTFQSAKLFPELTVAETIMVALEARQRTGSMIGALVSPVSAKRERAKRAQAADIIDFLGLGRYADAYIADLSTGTRRIVELAGLIALEAKMLCMDEPTAGLAQRETEAFGPLILRIRQELHASVLVIEHDMPLIMSISDRVYCLETGRVIASGKPNDVRNNPLVIASYLGTDDRAIERSQARS